MFFYFHRFLTHLKCYFTDRRIISVVYINSIHRFFGDDNLRFTLMWISVQPKAVLFSVSEMHPYFNLSLYSMSWPLSTSLQTGCLHSHRTQCSGGCSSVCSILTGSAVHHLSIWTRCGLLFDSSAVWTIWIDASTCSPPNIRSFSSTVMF